MKGDVVKEKKPFYKKLWFWLVIVIIVLAAVAGAGGNANNDGNTPAASESATSSVTESSEPEDQIKSIINKRVTDKYAQTAIDGITINENASSQSKGGSVVLVNLTWNVRNSEETSKEMLGMYSDDLAATVAQECSDVEELAIFWDIPYLDVDAKWAYERKGDSMILTDAAWA